MTNQEIIDKHLREFNQVQKMQVPIELNSYLHRMINQALHIQNVVQSLPIDEIQDYHIKRWANGLEIGATMQEIREDMIIAKKAIDLGNTLKERKIK